MVSGNTRKTLWRGHWSITGGTHTTHTHTSGQFKASSRAKNAGFEMVFLLKDDKTIHQSIESLQLQQFSVIFLIKRVHGGVLIRLLSISLDLNTHQSVILNDCTALNALRLNKNPFLCLLVSFFQQLPSAGCLLQWKRFIKHKWELDSCAWLSLCFISP